MGITPTTEIDFIDGKGRIYIINKTTPLPKKRRFGKLRGIVTIKMTTDKIMALSRAYEISIGFIRIEELESAVHRMGLKILEFPKRNVVFSRESLCKL